MERQIVGLAIINCARHNGNGTSDSAHGGDENV